MHNYGFVPDFFSSMSTTMCSREKRRNFYLENKGTKKVVICIVSSSWIVAGCFSMPKIHFEV